MASERTVCPDCAGPVDANRDRLCRRCGYPLMFLESEAAPEAAPIGRKPGERDDATIVLAPVAEAVTAEIADEPLAAGETRCANCGEPNPGKRIRCERCGHQVRRSDPVAAPPPPPPSDPPPRPFPARIVAVVVVTAAVVVGAAVLVRHFWDPEVGSADPSASATGGTTQVDRDVIDAEASSTIRNDPKYIAEKTLDGDPRTAWNSDGKTSTTNAGVRLTYTFKRDVRLARVTVTNGEGWSPADNHKNAWIKECVVAVGDRTWKWTMPETGAPQTKAADFGLTREVTVTVKTVYPGAKFKDLSVAEVSFDERP